jgi:hypothetical protein
MTSPTPHTVHVAPWPRLWSGLASLPPPVMWFTTASAYTRTPTYVIPRDPTLCASIPRGTNHDKVTEKWTTTQAQAHAMEIRLNFRQNTNGRRKLSLEKRLHRCNDTALLTKIATDKMRTHHAMNHADRSHQLRWSRHTSDVSCL